MIASVDDEAFRRVISASVDPATLRDPGVKLKITLGRAFDCVSVNGGVYPGSRQDETASLIEAINDKNSGTEMKLCAVSELHPLGRGNPLEAVAGDFVAQTYQ